MNTKLKQKLTEQSHKPTCKESVDNYCRERTGQLIMRGGKLRYIVGAKTNQTTS